MVAQLLTQGLASSVGKDILAAADELTFHTQLSAALPGEPVSHLHRLVLARMEQLPDTRTTDYTHSPDALDAHTRIIKAIEARDLHAATELIQTHALERSEAADFEPYFSDERPRHYE